MVLHCFGFASAQYFLVILTKCYVKLNIKVFTSKFPIFSSSPRTKQKRKKPQILVIDFFFGNTDAAVGLIF